MTKASFTPVSGGRHAIRQSLETGPLPPPRRITVGLVPLECLGGYSRVLGQRPHRRVTGAGHQHRRSGAVLGVVRQRAVPQLVKRGAAGGLGEQGGDLLVAQPGPAVRIEIGSGELDACFALGDE